MCDTIYNIIFENLGFEMYMDVLIKIDFDSLPIILTVEEVASLLDIKIHEAYVLFNSVSFPSLRIGKLFRISKYNLIEWLEQKE
jgi:excisionase family DNA binding protein